MIIDQITLINFIGTYFLVLMRVGTALMVMPTIGTRMVAMRVRLILVLSISFLLTPHISPAKITDVISVEYGLIMIEQLIIGMMYGLILQAVFQIFVLLGEIIAMQSGLGFAILNDPSANSSVPMVSQFYLLIITLLFFALDGHLVFFSELSKSFHHLPLDLTSISSINFFQIATLGGWLFTSAFKMSLPGITALLMINITFGIMTKAAPQLNIFTIGFPITMVVGLVIIWLNVNMILSHFMNLYSSAISIVAR